MKAIAALIGRMGTGQDVEHNPSILEAIKDALFNIGIPVIPIMIESIPQHGGNYTKNVEDVLLKIGDICVPTLIEFLNHPRYSVPHFVANVLRKLNVIFDDEEKQLKYLYILRDWDGFINLREKSIPFLVNHLYNQECIRTIISIGGKEAEILSRLQKSIPKGKTYKKTNKIADLFPIALKLYAEGYDFKVQYKKEQGHHEHHKEQGHYEQVEIVGIKWVSYSADNTHIPVSIDSLGREYDYDNGPVGRSWKEWVIDQNEEDVWVVDIPEEIHLIRGDKL